MKWGFVIVAPVVWLACASVWLVGAFVGVWATLAACLARAWVFVPGGGDHGGGCWRYTWPLMRWFQTWDNAACPLWYVERYGARRPLWLNLWIFSGWRNAFGGNPFNAIIDPAAVRWVSDNGSGVRLTRRMANDKATGGARRVYWQLVQAEWRVGVWVLVPFHRRPGTRNSHFEIRFGWKLYCDVPAPQVMVFSVWDTGPRFR